MEFRFGAWLRLKCASRKIHCPSIFHFPDSLPNLVFCMFFSTAFLSSFLWAMFNLKKRLCLNCVVIWLVFWNTNANWSTSVLHMWMMPQVQVREHWRLDQLESLVFLWASLKISRFLSQRGKWVCSELYIQSSIGKLEIQRDIPRVEFSKVVIFFFHPEVNYLTYASYWKTNNFTEVSSSRIYHLIHKHNVQSHPWFLIILTCQVLLE